MKDRYKNKIILYCLFAVFVMLVLSSVAIGRVDIYGHINEYKCTNTQEANITFYDTVGNDSIFCFYSDDFGTKVMCLNGTTGNVTIYNNLTTLKNITANHFIGNGSLLTGVTGGNPFNQDLNTTNSPTFAGLTLTGFNGFLKAVAGVVGTSAITVADITDITTNYLKLDGSNANQDIDIGIYDFTTSGNITAGAFFGDGGNITNISCGNPFDQWLNTTDNATFYNITATHNFIGDGSLLTGIVAGNMFNQWLNTTDNATFYNITATKYFIGDGSKLTGISSGNIFNQDLNTTDNASFTWLDIVNGVNASYFSGDGGNLTNLPCCNPFNQWLNTTDNATFYNITATKYFIGDGSKLTGISSGNIFNQDLNTTDNASFTWLDIVNGVNASYFSGDGGNLTNLPWSNPFNQVLNITSDVVFNKVTSTFHGDGGNLTNINASNLTGTLLLNPFNQWLNTTNNATFTHLNITHMLNVSDNITCPYIYGGDNSGETLRLYSNKVDAKCGMTLAANGDISMYSDDDFFMWADDDFNIYSVSDLAVKIDRSGYTSRIYGGDDSGDDLYLYATTTDSESRIELMGGDDINMYSDDDFLITVDDGFHVDAGGEIFIETNGDILLSSAGGTELYGKIDATIASEQNIYFEDGSDNVHYTIDTYANADFLPTGKMLHDCGDNKNNYFDDVYADDFVNLCDYTDMTSDESSNAILNINKTLVLEENGKYQLHIDFDSIPDWVRGFEKRYDEDGKWVGNFYKDGRITDDRDEGEWFGEYTDVLKNSYSVNKMQILLIETIKHQQKRIYELEDRIVIIERLLKID